MKTENANQIIEFLNAAYRATDCVVYDPLVAEERIWFSPADDLEEITAEVLEGNGNRNRNAYFGVNCGNQIRRVPPAQITPLCTSLISTA